MFFWNLAVAIWIFLILVCWCMAIFHHLQGKMLIDRRFFYHQSTYPPRPQTNISRENSPSQKESILPTMFKGELLLLGKVHLSQQCFSKSQPLTCSDAQYLHLLLPNNLQLLHWRPKIRAFHLNMTSKVVVDFSDVVFHAENGGTLGMVPLIIPILTLYSGIYWVYPLFRCVLVKDFLVADYFAAWKRDHTTENVYVLGIAFWTQKK